MGVRRRIRWEGERVRERVRRGWGVFKVKEGAKVGEEEVSFGWRM